MANDKKDILNDEKVQKMKDDVSSKIADAASEIKEEISEADQKAKEVIGDKLNDAGEVISEAGDKLEDSITEIKADALESVDNIKEVIEEKKKGVNISVGALVGIIVGCVAVAALIVFLIMNFTVAQPKYGKAEGKTVATVNGEKITDKDLGYYIYAEAMTQYYDIEGESADGDLSSFDWDQEIDGKKLSDTIKENAMKNAVADMVTGQQGEKLLTDDNAWTEKNDQQIQSTVDSYVQQFGEDGFSLRARSMGISSANEYARMYTTVMKAQNVQAAMEEDISKFTPEGVDLQNYTQDDRASVKHILIETTDPAAADPAATPDPTAVDDATGLATAQNVAQQAKSGGDFDQLMTQYNTDTSETSAGYTFKKGEMVEEFETAAFALKLNEISEPVKTDYGYHVIMRIPGLYEIQGYWVEQAKVSENKGNLDKVSVKAILDDVQAATEELENEQAAASAASGAGTSTSGGNSAADGNSAAGGAAAGE